MKSFKNIPLGIFVLGLVLLTPAWLYAQGTTFTYQGRLNTNAAPANGLYDFTFSLFPNAAGTGSPIGGSTITQPDIGVTNGLFTTTLNFGPVFTGNPTWLAISVRSNGAVSFTPLTPLQELDPTPYAVFANTASNISGTVSAAQIGGTPGSPSFSGTVMATSFSGNGANVTSVNAAQLNGLTAASFWQLTGNGGTTPGANFLGTKDNQPLELHVNNQRALRVEVGGPSSLVTAIGFPVVPTGAPNMIGGAAVNSVAPGVVGAVIAGGGVTNYEGGATTNSIGNFSDFSTIGGGRNNIIQANSGASTIAGGADNAIGTTSINSTVAGGEDNIILSDSPNSLIAGGQINQIGTNGGDASILGGQNNVIQATAPYCTVVGGEGNIIGNSSVFSVISGGGGNFIDAGGGSQVIAGGSLNTIGANNFSCNIDGGESNEIADGCSESVISGGSQNSISFGCPGSAIAGGFGNFVGLMHFPTNAFVAGGFGNDADGNFSFAAGHLARAVNTGTFVWADSQGATFSSTSNNQFCVRAAGGVQLDGSTSVNFGATARQMLNLFTSGTINYAIGVQSSTLYFRTGGDAVGNGFAWYRGGTNNTGQNNNGGGATLMTLNNAGLVVNGTFVSSSDRNAKQDFAPINPEEILEKVTAMPITEWIYKTDTGTRHIGPMAQDFYAAFAVGPDDRHITTVDEGGVALAAIQGLNQKLEDQRAENAKLKQQNDSLAQRLNELEAAVRALGEKK